MPAPSLPVRRLASLLLLSLLVAGCVTPPAATPTPTQQPDAPPTLPDDGGHLVYALGFEPSLLDPHQAGSFDAHLMFMHLYDVLVWLGPDGDYHPGLATDWASEEDGRIWTFTLRQGVTFHDGTPFDAAAVKFTFDRIADPATQAFNSRDLLGPYERSEVVDAATVRVYFTRPYAAFLDAVSQHFMAPVSPAAVQQYGAEYARHQVGTGPFVWGEYVAQDHLTLLRNPDYNWAPDVFQHQGPATLESVTFTFVPSSATRAGVLESGEVHIAQDLLPTDIVRLQGDAGFQLVQAPIPGLANVLLINTESGPTAELAVRQALNLSLDKAALIQLMFQGLSAPASGPLAQTTAYYDASVESLYPYDPAEAARLLDEAGWQVGGDGIRVKDGRRLALQLNTMPFNRYPEIFQVAQAQWKDAGMDVQINVLPTWGQFSAAGHAGEHSLMPYFLPASDPHFALVPFFHSANIASGLNFTRFASDELDALLDAGVQTTDPTERARIYADIQRLIMENALIVPVYQVYNNTVARAEVVGLRFDRRGWYPWLYDVQLREDRQ